MKRVELHSKLWKTSLFWRRMTDQARGPFATEKKMRKRVCVCCGVQMFRRIERKKKKKRPFVIQQKSRKKKCCFLGYQK